MSNKIKTIEELKAACQNSAEVEQMRLSVGYNIKPQFKRLLVKLVPWKDIVKTDSGLVIATNYEPTKSEMDRGQHAMANSFIQRAVIVECSNDVREEYAPGMHIAMMEQERQGFSTRIRIANSNGIGVEDYYFINEHEILGVIIEDRLTELKAPTPEETRSL